MMKLLQKIGVLLDRQIPDRMRVDPETARHAKLMTRFGSLGAIFGLVYALFYSVIEHTWGVGIVMACTVGVALSPLFMQGNGSIERAANFFAAILTVGFLGLCFVEGGVHGHAIAWLVSVPLCVLLLAGIGPAAKWVLIAFLSAAFIVGLDLAGIDLPVTYDEKWIPIVSGAGYLGLFVFMFILGLIFETGRATAAAKMQAALAQLEQSNLELVAMNKEKNEFLGIAAHDLKNPLTAILGSGEMLKIIKDERDRATLAGTVVLAAQRMRQLITNLLDVHAIEEGRFASNLEKCDFGDLIKKCVELNQPAASRKEIRLELVAPEYIAVKADGAAAAQILDNLVSNAVKYTPFKTTVRIQLAVEKAMATVRISDQGPGINAEDRQRLFQKFSRLSAIPTGGESSTGLGLAIARRLTEAMSGTIGYEDSTTGGSTFVLRLPLWETAAGQQIAA